MRYVEGRHRHSEESPCAALSTLYNDIDVLNITSAPGSGGNVNVDPRFVGLNNHHLQLTTPLYNAGTAAPPGGSSNFDLDGDPRLAFGAVDIGAYELQVQPDEIFANDFE